MKINFFLFFLFLSSNAFADEYVLVMSKNDNVCQHMLRLYNDDLKQFDKINYDRHEEFNAIKWAVKNYYVIREGKKEYPKRPYDSNSSVLISNFDINNNGKKELVIKNEISFNGILSDDLIYLENEDASLFEDDECDIKSTYNKAIAQIGSGPWKTYKLKELPQFLYLGIGDKESKAYYSLGAYLYIHPFFFDGTYYLDMRDEVPLDIKDIFSSKFLVILKYTNDNRSKDTCYFLKTTNCKKSQQGGK